MRSRQVHWPSTQGRLQALPALPVGWRLLAAEPRHLDALARLHAGLMPEDLLPSLGGDLLREAFWPRLLSSPHAQVWVIERDDGEVVAFAVMAMRRLALRLGFYRDAAFCLRMLGRLLLQPRWLWRGMITLLAPIRLHAPLGPVPAELILLGVHPEAQGQGLGQWLLRHALQAIGAVACLVKTASDDARRFYQRAGFVSQGRELRDIRSLHWLVRREVACGPDQVGRGRQSTSWPPSARAS